MYRIGEFSLLSKTTIKTLRYYEKEGLLIPKLRDVENGYRFYDADQLLELSKIISLRQMGLSIENIKSILKGNDFEKILKLRKKELETEISISNDQLSRIKNYLEGKEMPYEVIVKELPEYTIYYKEGIIKDFSEIVDFILSSGKECKELNPQMKCINPDYCYVNYLDEEFKPINMKVRYAQAVTEMGKESDTIKFEKLKSVTAACVYHKGSYSKLGEAYAFIVKWIKDNGYEITEPIRERYIDGMWNKESEEEWLTELQVPVTK